MVRRRNAIPMWRKQEVTQWIIDEDNNCPTRAEAHFRRQNLDVDGAAIRKWWRDRNEIMAAEPTQKRLAGGGRKPLSIDMELLLYDEVIDKRLRKEKVTRSWICDMGQTIYTSLHSEEDTPRPFGAFTHWLANFMARFELSLRCRTNHTVLTDEKLVARAVAYMRFLGDDKMDVGAAIQALPVRRGPGRAKKQRGPLARDISDAYYFSVKNLIRLLTKSPAQCMRWALMKEFEIEVDGETTTEYVAGRVSG